MIRSRTLTIIEVKLIGRQFSGECWSLRLWMGTMLAETQRSWNNRFIHHFTHTWSAVSFNIRGVIQSGPQDFVISRELSWLRTSLGEMVTELMVVPGETFDLSSFIYYLICQMTGLHQKAYPVPKTHTTTKSALCKTNTIIS